MKTISRADTYQCEVCGTEYKFKELAQMCETFLPLNPEELDVKVGDTILCESRYDGWFELVVEKIKVRVSSSYADYLNNSDNPLTPYRYTRGEYEGREMSKLEYAKENRWQPHQYIFITNEDIMVCKDGDRTDEWERNSIVANYVWNTDFSRCDASSVHLKMVDKDGNISIRCGSLDWFNEHWQRTHKLVAWTARS